MFVKLSNRSYQEQTQVNTYTERNGAQNIFWFITRKLHENFIYIVVTVQNEKYYIHDQNIDTLTKEIEEPIVKLIAMNKITLSHLVTINMYTWIRLNMSVCRIIDDLF